MNKFKVLMRVDNMQDKMTECLDCGNKFLKSALWKGQICRKCFWKRYRNGDAT
jgi:hypothetical protein